MAHINYTRNAAFVSRRSVEEIFPDSNWAASFAVFCGEPQQRHAAGMQAIRRCCGHVGVVVLQNDPRFAALLGGLRRSLAGSGTPVPAGFRTYSVNPYNIAEHYYDPLYGMDRSAILDAVIPQNRAAPDASVIAAARAGLGCYLDVMELQFRRDPAPFGGSPYDLDLLWDLVRLDYQRLDRSVLQHLPEPDRARIREKLSSGDLPNIVYDRVADFVTLMESTLWTWRGFGGHTCVSIAEAVRRRCVISITLPAPSPALLQYLYHELQSLQQARVPFLLVNAEVSLTGCPDLCGLFTSPHESGNYLTGILAADPSYVLSSPQMIAPLLTQHREVLLFNCNSSEQAELFSAALGTYQRKIQDDHRGKTRQPFHIFSSTTRGVATREVTERNFTVNDLTSQPEGAVLCGALYLTPIQIRQVSLTPAPGLPLLPHRT